jgi:SNF2 family DNA or RNA helicase
MVTIKKYNYNFVKVAVNVKSGNFAHSIDCVKEMPVRIYKASGKYWLVPIRDVSKLMRKFKKEKIKFDVENIKNILNYVSDYTLWRKEQYQAKRLYSIIEPENGVIKKYIKEMDLLNLKLRPFQAVGASFIFNSDASVICDPVGLGKTVQALACAEKRMVESESNFNFVICPSTLKRNWSDEIEKFTDKSFIAVEGSKSKRKNIYKKSYQYDYLIVNYDVLFNDLDILKKFIFKRDGFRVNLIIDEIQYINNRQTQRAKATKELADLSYFVTGLSATLLENKITDLFNSFQVIDSSVFGDNTQYYSFVKRFCKVNYFGNIVGYKNPELIKKRIAPYFIRRLKDDVLDELPARIENNYWIKLSSEQRKLYNDTKKKLVNQIKDIEKKHKIMIADILPMITYLRQCVLSTKLIGYEDNISTKTEELIRIIQSVNKKDKMVIFCHYPLMVELLFETMQKNKITAMALHGKGKLEHHCPSDERIELVNEFNNNKTRVLLTSDILREGVNIPSANYIINFDLLFNPFKVEQRIGRIDRLDTKHKSINIINIIAEKTVEENIYHKFYTKRDMAKDLLDNNKPEQRLTIKTVKSLFEL